ncbi:MAG: hypothetical protein R2911_03830 [Caldilineaceae bacterium]
MGWILVYLQFLTWIKGIVTEGKFGYSFAYRTDAGSHYFGPIAPKR